MLVTIGVVAPHAEGEHAEQDQRREREIPALHSVGEDRAYGGAKAEDQHDDLPDAAGCDSAAPPLTSRSALARHSLREPHGERTRDCG